MYQIIDGKALAKKIREKLKEENDQTHGREIRQLLWQDCEKYSFE